MTTPDSPAGSPAALAPVLIAEDEAASRRLLEATLRRWGHEVAVTEQILAPQLRAMHEARDEQPRDP